MAGNNALLGEVGVGSTVLGGLTSAISSIIGGEDQQEMYNYQAGVAKLNANIAKQNATYSSQVGEIQAANAGEQGAQRLGKIKVAQAASGLDVNSGSAVQVRASQTAQISHDVSAIRSNAAKVAYNYEVTGVGYTADAQLDTLKGQNARSAGLIGAGSSLIGAASSVSSEWLRGQQLGMWGAPS